MARSKRKDDLVSRYARIRKPVPPPERVEKDRAEERVEKADELEVDEALAEFRTKPSEDKRGGSGGFAGPLEDSDGAEPANPPEDK